MEKVILVIKIYDVPIIISINLLNIKYYSAHLLTYSLDLRKEFDTQAHIFHIFQNENGQIAWPLQF